MFVCENVDLVLIRSVFLENIEKIIPGIANQFPDALQTFKGFLARREITPLLGKLAFDKCPLISHRLALGYPLPFLSSRPLRVGMALQKSDANDDSNKGTAHESLDKLRPIREQKGLFAAQSAGLESVQGLLLANDGGTASGNQSTKPRPPSASLPLIWGNSPSSPVVDFPSPVAHSASRAPSDASAHAPSEPSVGELQELFDRVRSLEQFERAVNSDIDDAVERVSALKVRVPSSGGLTVAALSTALASRFQDITSDRDKLNAEIHFQAEKQAKIVAKLQLEHTELQDALSDLRLTIARLELGTPAPPVRIRDHSPARRNTEVPHVSSAPTKSLSTYPVRPRSPVAGPSAKRLKTEGFLTMGPLPSSRLAPRDFFKSLIDEALPTFVLSRYDVILDPVYEYHLRVTMDLSSDGCERYHRLDMVKSLCLRHVCEGPSQASAVFITRVPSS
ncbi:hypothetical protein B0H13DRAFT_2364802 [Mycena leptocephala]|nr:hypothetical protein B0H13DRAFT_2364802 [Mycena leptocephala]